LRAVVHLRGRRRILGTVGSRSMRNVAIVLSICKYPFSFSNRHAKADSSVQAQWLGFVCFGGIVMWFAIVRRSRMSILTAVASWRMCRENEGERKEDGQM
jgi:hypothetical protein